MWNAISPGIELVSPCPIPATITITPRAPHSHQIVFWLSIRIYPYHPALLAGSSDCTLCLHRADVCKFLQFSQNWCVHVWESFGEHNLWVDSYFSTCARYVIFVILGGFLRWELRGQTAALLLWVAVSIFQSNGQQSCRVPHGFFLQAFH